MTPPKYTFDNFVITDGNELACAAALAITKEPRKYNPFFLYGESGSGKTHLLHAIANAMQKQHKSYRILYVNGEKLQLDLVSALKKNKVADFEERYQNWNVLMIDDIDVFLNNEESQKEITCLLDVLCATNKQVLITSKLTPSCLPIIELHFHSSYDNGLIADIAPLKKEVGHEVTQKEIDKTSKSNLIFLAL